MAVPAGVIQAVATFGRAAHWAPEPGGVARLIVFRNGWGGRGQAWPGRRRRRGRGGLIERRGV